MIRFFKKNPFWLVALMAVAAASIYWGAVATDRYVSRAHIVLQSPEIIPTSFNVSSLLSGTSGSGDLLLLQDYLQSVDILKKIDKQLNLRKHYTQSKIDWLSRLESQDVPIETFYKYMQSMITVHYDDYAQLLEVRVQAFSPDMAQKIVKALLKEGENHMNEMGQRLAEEQLKFIDQQAQNLEKRLFDARDEVLKYQNEHGLVAPTQTVEAIFSTVSRLQAELALLNARIKAQKTYQSDRSPEIRRMESQAKAMQEQIDIEQNKLATASGHSLNQVSAEFETLQMRAKFALEQYSNALTARESTRVEASRKLKQISVLEYPTLPEFSTRPERLYNVTVFALMSLLLAGIFHLIVSVIRDHRD